MTVCCWTEAEEACGAALVREKVNMALSQLGDFLQALKKMIENPIFEAMSSTENAITLLLSLIWSRPSDNIQNMGYMWGQFYVAQYRWR